MHTKDVRRSGIAVLLALGLGACAYTVEPSDAPDQTASIEEVSEALGNFTTVWNGTLNGEVPLAMGYGWSAFNRTAGTCDQVDLVRNSDGALLGLAGLPTCSIITAAGGDGTLLVGTTGQQIYQTVYNFGWTWQLLANTSGTNISKILEDGNSIYWQDSSGVYRVPFSGGTPTKIGFSNRTLLAADYSHSVLWVQRDDGGGQWSLRTIGSTNGLPELIVATNNMPFAPGFWEEESYVWWVENGAADGINRIRRLTKSTGTIDTIKLSSSVTYRLPMRTGSALYYVDKNIADGSMTMRRHNFANGQQTSAALPANTVEIPNMRLETSVYFTSAISTYPPYVLKAGDL